MTSSNSTTGTLSEQLLREALARAVTIARRGPDSTPNPQVGCVLVDGAGKIVAEGWHQGAGTPHAEVAALAALPTSWQELDTVSGQPKTQQLTAVVTLEPCTHYGRTGPCTKALLAAGIKHVAYGATDPNPAAGGGSAELTAAGVQVIPLNDAACGVLLADWLRRNTAPETSGDSAAHRQQQPHTIAATNTQLKPHTNTPNRPYIVLKWAQTLDGRAAANDGTSQWITGQAARQDVHRRRAQCAAIAAGTGTVLADNPSLTARTPTGDLLVPAAAQPVPVVFGSRDIPATASIMHHPALAAHALAAPLHYPREVGLPEALRDLYERGFTSLFVEGGPQLIAEFVKAGFYDEILIYVSPTLLGGTKLALTDIGVGTISDIKRFNAVETVQLGTDILVRVLANQVDTISGNGAGAATALPGSAISEKE